MGWLLGRQTVRRMVFEMVILRASLMVKQTDSLTGVEMVDLKGCRMADLMVGSLAERWALLTE